MKLILLIYYIASVATAADVDFFTKADMESKALGSYEGWTLVAHFDLSIYGTDRECPSPWQAVVVNGKFACKIPSDNPGCSSVKVSISTPYNQTYGMVSGYQKGTTDGFRASQDDGYRINEPYVDGVSITLGDEQHRRHVWTYAAGLTKNANRPNNNCPCAVTSGPDAPSFVGENYYCSSGSPHDPDKNTVYTDDPLWQGDNCNNNRDSCCTDVGMPWFHRVFPTTQHDDIEVRICYNQDYFDEAILVDKLELYVS